MVMHEQKQKKMEFSKFIYILNLGFVAVVTGLSFLCVVKSGEWGIIDLSPIAIICSSSYAELAVFSAMYAKKAQAENVLKIGKQIQEENIHIQNIETANQIMNNNS